MSISSEDQAPSATLQLATPDPDGAKRRIPCLFQGIEGKRLSLQASEPVPISSAVSVEFNDALFLGEVVACSTGSVQSCAVEVKVEQILSGLQNLMTLRSRLLGEGMPQASALMPAYR